MRIKVPIIIIKVFKIENQKNKKIKNFPEIKEESNSL